MPNQPAVYIVILNWNRWEDSVRCIESVHGLDYPNYRLVLIDNGSEDDSVAHIQTWAAHDAAQHTLICYDEHTAWRGGDTGAEARLREAPCAQSLVVIGVATNLGFAGGCNLGIAYALHAGADHVFILNNDARLMPDTLSQLVAVAADADAAVVGARVRDETGSHELYAGRAWPQQLFGGKQVQPDLAQPFWPSSEGEGSAVLLRRDLLAQRMAEVGYAFDPHFFMYCEDVDLGLYAQARSYHCVIARDAVVYHGLGQSSGGQGNPRSYYYITRNRIYLANRWLPWHWKLVFHLYYVPSRLALQLLRPVTPRTRPVRGAVLGGLLDGYRQVQGKWKHHAG